MSFMRPRFFLVMMVGLFFTELAWAQDTRWKTDPLSPATPSGIHGAVSGTNPWQYQRSYHAPVYTYPPVMTVPVIPKAYMEKNAREMQQNHWHFYCRNSQAYFPHAKDCPQGWEVVNLQPDLR